MYIQERLAAMKREEMLTRAEAVRLVRGSDRSGTGIFLRARAAARMAIRTPARRSRIVRPSCGGP
jgi:hypothetical protein